MGLRSLRNHKKRNSLDALLTWSANMIINRRSGDQIRCNLIVRTEGRHAYYSAYFFYPIYQLFLYSSTRAEINNRSIRSFLISSSVGLGFYFNTATSSGGELGQILSKSSCYPRCKIPIWRQETVSNLATGAESVHKN